MQKLVLLRSIMGRVPKSHSIHVQNPTKCSFSNKDLVWRFGICHGGQNKVTIQFAYVPYARILEFLEGECEHPYGMECLQKISKPNGCQPTNYQKPPWTYVVNIYGINRFNFFNSYTKDVIIYILKVFWSMYQCGYGLKDYWENSTHIRSIKWRCLASFLIKHLYTRLDVVEITIYHKAHTRTNGSFTHGEHDLKSIFHMFCYDPCMSQALKDHIWAQLSLGYTGKQIYGKH